MIRVAGRLDAPALRRRRLAGAALLAALALSASPASGDPVAVEARFEPSTGQTRVTGGMAPEACVTFALRGEWRLRRADASAVLQATASEAELDIRLRPGTELRDYPQPDLAGREAAALQRIHEEVVGKPAQAVVHEPTAVASVSRWSATWIDANSPGPGHALTVETFIVDLTGRSALELTLTNAHDREAYRAEIGRLLSSLRVAEDPCRDPGP
jgi:hypothetical protein